VTSSSPAHSRGFSLIELMTVVSIVAILGALAMPSFREILASRRVQATASALSQALKSAQSEAIRRNRTVEVIFTTSQPVPAEVVAATAVRAASATAFIARLSNPAVATDFVAGHRIGESGGSSIDSASVTSIGFTPAGRPVDRSVLPAGVALAESIVLRVTDAGSARRMCVAVATGGSVRICDPKRAPGSAAACQPALAAGAC